ncbi:hypothetical protein [Salinivibrio kushneri]|uniref:hypothetical protein n=1 Tax=Salinivibrio kushneri TaxID=1908198 RepID=UPI000984BB4C|nr:hypothetical protein [Salinivibrio kushneri]OOE51969.1 hypothetical protein BZG11_05705 [Salinivibrio kushneri]OOE59588.1 hypothetical protein BZG18_13120 [Salinivibrio kushneri]
MYSYIKPFKYCPTNHIVNDGFECFEFSDNHLDYIEKLSPRQGRVIETIRLPELAQQGCPYDLTIPQLPKNVISNIVIHSDIIFDFSSFFDPVFNNKTGKTLSLFIFQDLGSYWSKINTMDNSDYRMGVFLTNEQINISHLESKENHTPCLNCHYLNVIGNHIEQDPRNNEWQQFFHFLMKQELGAIASRPLRSAEHALVAGIVHQIATGRLVAGSSNTAGISPFDCGAIHLSDLNKSQAKMHWNYQCGCAQR